MTTFTNQNQQPETDPKNTSLEVRIANSIEIEKYYNKCEETTYSEAILQWVEENDIDIVSIKYYIADALIEKLKYESIRLHKLKSETDNTFTLDSLM